MKIARIESHTEVVGRHPTAARNQRVPTAPAGGLVLWKVDS